MRSQIASWSKELVLLYRAKVDRASTRRRLWRASPLSPVFSVGTQTAHTGSGSWRLVLGCCLFAVAAAVWGFAVHRALEEHTIGRVLVLAFVATLEQAEPWMSAMYFAIAGLAVHCALLALETLSVERAPW